MLFGVICILLWGLIPVVSVLGMKGLDQYQFLFLSSLVSFLTLGLLTLTQKQGRKLKGQSMKFWLQATVLGLLGTFFYYFCLYQGYKLGSNIEVLSVQYTWPAWIIVFALLVSKTNFKWHHGMVIVSGIASVLLVISKGNISALVVPDLAVLLWVLLGAAGFALFSVLSKGVKMAPLPLNTVFFGVASIASFILLQSKSYFALPSFENIGALLANGILVNGISYYFWVAALRKTKPEYLSLLTFLTPLVSVLYLVVLFNEPFYPAYYLAFAMVVISGIVSVLAGKKA